MSTYMKRGNKNAKKEGKTSQAFLHIHFEEPK